MAFRVPSAPRVKKAKEVPAVTPAQLVLKGRWEKGVLLATAVFRARMAYRDPRGRKERGVLWAPQALKAGRGTQDAQVNRGCQALGV